VLGFVQSGYRAHADRYTYLPQIGLGIAVTWAVAGLGAGWRHRRWLLGGLGTIVLAALAFCAHRQTAYWRNGESLWKHTLACTSDNAVAHNGFGIALAQRGRVEEAIAQYERALQIKPDYAESMNNLAWLLATCPDARIRDGTQAVKYAERACEQTHYGMTLFVGTLAAAYAEAGRFDEAIATAEKACALAEAAGEEGLLARNQQLLALYRAHQPYREPAEK